MLCYVATELKEVDLDLDLDNNCQSPDGYFGNGVGNRVLELLLLSNLQYFARVGLPVDSSTDQFGDKTAATRQDDSVNDWDDSATR